MFIKIIKTFFAVIVLTSPVLGDNPPKQLQQDIHILEGVLEKLIHDEESLYRVEGNIHGLYLDDYGVLFHTERVAPSHVIVLNSLHENMEEVRKSQVEMRAHIKEMELRRKAMEDQRKVLQEKIEVMVTTDGTNVDTHVEEIVLPEVDFSLEKMKEKQQKAVTLLEDKIRRFLEKYASTVEGLKNQSRVAVMIRLDNWQIDNKKNEFLVGWVSYKDILLFREQKISLKQFQKKINIQKSGDQNGVNEEIAIMTEILNRGAQSGMDSKYNQWMGSNSGMYMNGLGVLFFVDSPNVFWRGDSSNSVRFLHSGDGDQYIYGWTGRKRGNNKDTAGKIDAMKSNMVQSMAKYGHTLSIDPNENIIIYMDLNQYLTDYSGSMPGHMLLQIKKADADAYYRGAISYEEFQKRLISR